MSLFWFNNFHFAIEFFGAVALVVAAWLAFDAYLLTREKKSILKILGFGLFAAWQALHALDVADERALLFGMALLIAGLFCIALSIFIEAPPPRPKAFELVFVIPSVAGLLGRTFIAAGFLALLAAVIALRRYFVELNKSLKAVWIGFGLLAASFFLGSVSFRYLAPDFWWASEHALRAAGFGVLTLWVWQYLRPRMKEELLLIFVAMSLTVSLVVTFTFSALLLARMRADASESLSANTKTFSYALRHLIAEAKSKSERAALDPPLLTAVAGADAAGIEDAAKILRESLGIDFVTVTDQAGTVLLRATYLTARNETLREEPSVSRALAGTSHGDFGTMPPEGLSVRGASPLRDADHKIVGAVEVGFLLDNPFLDNFKKNTGLDATLFLGDALRASTVVDIDGLTRPVGATLSDANVRTRVLEARRPYTGSAVFFGKPHLASYLPLQDAQGSPVGIIAASRPEVEISKAAVATNRLTLFTTLAIVLALLIPAYLVVRKVSEEA